MQNFKLKNIKNTVHQMRQEGVGPEVWGWVYGIVPCLGLIGFVMSGILSSCTYTLTSS